MFHRCPSQQQETNLTRTVRVAGSVPLFDDDGGRRSALIEGTSTVSASSPGSPANRSTSPPSGMIVSCAASLHPPTNSG